MNKEKSHFYFKAKSNYRRRGETEGSCIAQLMWCVILASLCGALCSDGNQIFPDFENVLCLAINYLVGQCYSEFLVTFFSIFVFLGSHFDVFAIERILCSIKVLYVFCSD